MKVSKALSYLLPLCIVFLLFLVTPSTIVFAEKDDDKFVTDMFESDSDKEAKPELPVVTDKDEPAADLSKDEAASVSSWGDYVRMIFAFIFVIGLLFALLKFLNRKNRMFDQHRLMKNVGGLSLGQQKSVQLVVIGDSYYLIGVGDEVRLLKEITDPDEIQRLEDYFDENEAGSPPGLVSKLLSIISNKKNNPSEDDGQQADFKNMFTSRLDELKEERRKHLSRLEEKESRKDE